MNLNFVLAVIHASPHELLSPNAWLPYQSSSSPSASGLSISDAIPFTPGVRAAISSASRWSDSVLALPFISTSPRFTDFTLIRLWASR